MLASFVPIAAYSAAVTVVIVLVVYVVATFLAILLSNCVWIELVTLSKYPISVEDTVPIEVVLGKTTVPVKVGDAIGA